MENGSLVEAHVDPIEDDLHDEKVSLGPPDLLNCIRTSIWLTIFQVDKVKSLLRAALQKHKEKPMESLKPNRYQYGVRLMTVANTVFERLGLVEGDDMPEQKRTLFLQGKILSSLLSKVATVDFVFKRLPMVKSRKTSGVWGAFG